MLNCREIFQLIPHRYPFLLVDKVLEMSPGKNATGVKNVSVNEPFFQGHFPCNPIMPGVLIVEALAQLGAIVVMSEPQNKGKLALFTGIDNFKFRHQVMPGDILLLEVELLKFRHGVGKAAAAAYVQDKSKLAASGEISFALVNTS